MPLNTNDVEYLLNECRIKLPGSSDSGIKQELWGVMKEFLQDTNGWIETQTLMVTAGTTTYTLTPRDGGQIIRLLSVVDGNKIPVGAIMADLGVLSVTNPISVSSVAVAATDTTTASNHPWKVTVVKNIMLPGTRDDLPIAPNFVLGVYSGTVVDGVLGKMMMQQAKTYTNLALGKYHLQRFRDGIGIARNDIWNQNLFGGQRWQFPRGFAGGGSQSRGGVSNWPAETV